jgi:hypothetical protein
MKQSACRSCGAPIIWALTRNDKRMPIDVGPVEGGNVEIVARDTRRDVPYVVVHAQPPMGVDKLYMSHFATCPNAETHRK